jgi:hypothetical protein
VSVFRLILGIAFLALGSVTLLARDRIVARHRSHNVARRQPAMLWIVMGGLYLLIGAVWLAAAFA